MTMNARTIALACGLAALAGCASTTTFAEGDVMKPVAPPSDAAACDLRRWDAVSRPEPFYTSDYINYLYLLSHTADTSRALSYTYDLQPGDDGLARPVNIRFVGPLAYLENNGTRPAIRANGKALVKWTYAWRGDGDAPYAEGCEVEIQLNVAGGDELEH